jgi:hypothetical protein
LHIDITQEQRPHHFSRLGIPPYSLLPFES